jgi:basic membrane protein A
MTREGLRGLSRVAATWVALSALSSALLVPGDTAAQAKPKVAFVYTGPVGDAGWTFQHDVARKHLEQALGADTTFVESMPETADAVRVMEQLIQKGYKILFMTSFGYQKLSLEVAKKHPDVHIVGTGPGIGLAPNVKTMYGRIWEPRYLTGLIAGKMTKSNIVGFVAAHPTPGVLPGVNAFALGVWAANPRAKVKVVWTRTWYDPPKEKAAAKALIDAGADVIGQHQDSPAPVQAAAEAGKYAIGNNSNMAPFGPKAFLTGPVYDWRPIDEANVKAILAGQFKSEDYYGGLSDGLLSLAPLHEAIPDSVKKLVEQARQDIISGKLQIFKGPIKDQEGNLRVPAGEVMSLKDITSTRFLVQGIDGPSPTAK